MSSRVAVVTGASRGIGRAIAVALARRGHLIGVLHRDSTEQAKETLAEIEGAGGIGLVVQADVASQEDVKQAFDQVNDLLGPVTILVNNAGVRRDGLALRMSDAHWDEVLKTNLYGPFVCSRRALRSMLQEKWGRIVNITSIAGSKGSPGQTNYSAAKAGLIGFTRSLALEVASRNVTVNAVAPGLVATELTRTLTGERYRQLEEAVPLGRAGTPDEVASLVAFLCSEEASYMSGSVTVADGAMTA